MALSSNSLPEVMPFENLGDLRREHDQLLERYNSLIGGDDSSEGETQAAAAMKSEIADFIDRGLATGVVLDAYSERTTAQTLVDYWITLQIRCGEEVRRRRLAGFDEQRLPELDDSLCPYVGLEPFHDDTYFYGRDADIERLHDVVASNRLVIVHGSSGSGKSSLVFGGLVPRLRGEQPPGWSTRSFTPSLEPAERLAAATGEATGARHLIIIDQFEELFTLVSDDARDRFDAALGELLVEAKHVHVVATVREEFYARLSRLSSCETYIDFSMRPLGYAELTEAIEAPAAKINLTFERGIVETLVAEVLGQPAALPLLQFSLLQLWNARKRNRITRAALDEIGGPRTALARAADAFVDSQIGETEAEIRRVLLELVRVDDLLESYRQPVSRSQLAAAGNARTSEVIALLEKADLIRVTPHEAGGDSIVEIKHEAIIRNWPRLDSWIVQKRKLRRNLLALARSAQAWDKAGRPKEGLYRGWQLQEVPELEVLSKLEQDFILASRADVEREIEQARERAKRYARLLKDEQLLSARRRFLLLASISVLVTVVAVAGVLLWLQRNETQRYVHEAQEAKDERDRAEDAKRTANRIAEEAKGKAQSLERTSRALEQEANRQQERITKLKAVDAGFRKRVEASRGLLSGRYLAFYAHGQVDAMRVLVSIMKDAAKMRSDLANLPSPPNKETFLAYYYAEDKQAAQKVAELFDAGLGVKMSLIDKANDPTFFGPQVAPENRPLKALLELYFAEGGVPSIDGPSQPAPTPE